MAIARFAQVTKTFGYRTVLSGISFEVAFGERLAIVGPNGVGKTTLLRMLVGGLEPDAGAAWVDPGARVACLPQHLEFAATATLESELAKPPPEYPVRTALKRFGFRDIDPTQPVSTMSGGQKTRLALMAIWVQNPSVLILDEPTNHLDTASLDWLESFVRGFRGTVIIVSHDRYFLDRVASRVVELSATSAVSYEGNCTAYREKKTEQRRHHEKAWEEQEKRGAAIERAVTEQLRWFHISHRDAGKQSDLRKGVKEFERARAARIAKRAKSNIKRLERMRESGIERPTDDATVNLAIRDPEKTGRRVVMAHGLAKAFVPGRPLFEGGELAVNRGDKVGLVGPNAAGKTTLLRVILGHEPPTQGEVWVSQGARVGYMDQEMAGLRPEASTLDSALEAIGRTDAESITRARNLLGSFLLRGDDVMKRVGVLSYGERMRLCLVRLLLADFNLLVLDEPTNHLDLPTREQLEEALEAYEGTLLLVSHDRYLLSRVCNRILAVEGGRIDTYLGGYQYFLEERARRAREGHEQAARSERRRRADDQLLMRNRLAVLSADLAKHVRDTPEYAAAEAEFLQVARSLCQ